MEKFYLNTHIQASIKKSQLEIEWMVLMSNRSVCTGTAIKKTRAVNLVGPNI